MSSDDKDKTQARATLVALVVVGLLALAATVLALPLLGEATDGIFSAGVGLKDAAVISFFVTMALLVVFAISSGDGLIGELQFILGGFFSFFIVIWLLIAWIF
ncbi:hypothetical protein KO507_01430 [Gilvimarinus agarilyticus]|uniref:hypothetical protein n=1 Tax=unclassified Gilvimarinus TaxID=2642066 RepID=UPI001C0A0C22|nr:MULTISPECIES: hypothetical protein [unclassified Gilvimarinus]MBU2884420.1 hypothetical protein [Gilvimarinus agarilyticus]MDO6569556.1 hypothetical protein [Gilvimarinus sp. 2_MG-2023]MDO6748119.1 hypothetical protein [Gilvimarinus sp. 1_MG-2023]